MKEQPEILKLVRQWVGKAEQAVVLAQAVRKKVRELLPKEVLNEEA
ncbi:MAG: hypothetical protein IIC50_24730 [Planctomycetes bacterium]|nr:hypothetical protein [Planctomycetota bacterium]